MHSGSDKNCTSTIPASVRHLKCAFNTVSQLAEASSLLAFAQAGGLVDELRGWLSTFGTNTSVAFEELDESEALHKLCSALGKGWQLLFEQLGLMVTSTSSVRPQDELLSGHAAVQALQALSVLLLVDAHASTEIRVRQGQQIAASGLLESMSLISDTLAETLDRYRLHHQQCRDTVSQKQLKVGMKKGFLAARPQQQQQQQQPRAKPMDSAYFGLLASLATDVAWLHVSIGAWLSAHLSGNAYARTVLPAAKLAVAVLRLKSSTSSTSTSNSSSSTSSCSSAMGALDDAVDRFITLAAVYTYATAIEVPFAPGMQRSAVGPESKVIDETTLQIVRSSEYLELLVLGMCSMTSNLHYQQNGRSYLPASYTQIRGFLVDWQQQQRQQQLVVPAYHEQCFSVLGLDKSPVQRPPLDAYTGQQAVELHLLAISVVLSYQMDVSDEDIQQQSVLNAKLILQLPRLMLELLLLVPDPGLNAVPNGLNLMLNVAHLVGLGPEEGACRTAEEAAAAMKAAGGPTVVTDWLSDAVLYVAPTVCHFIRQQAASAAADKPGAAAAAALAGAEQVAAAYSARKLNTMVLECVLLAADDVKDNNSTLVSVFQKQPLRTLATLEAIVRSYLASWMADGAATTAIQPQQPVANAADDMFRLLLLGLSPASALSSLAGMSAALAAEMLQPLPYACSMVISTLKCCRVLYSSRSTYSARSLTSGPWRMLIMSAKCLPEPERVSSAHLQLLQAASSNSKLHGGRKGVSGLVPWIVIVGRGLSFVGIQLQQLAALSAQLVAQDSMLTYSTVIQVQQALDAITDGLHHLQKQLGRLDPAGCISSAAVSEAELVDLQKRAATLEQLVTSAVESFQSQYEPVAMDRLPVAEGLSMASTDNFEEAKKAIGHLALPCDLFSEEELVDMITTAIGSQLPTEMIDLGNAVCGAFPLPYCCNNPECDDFSQLSELELVGGKGAVCSRCQVARYCGKECQVAHWRQHKHACKAIERNK